MKNTYTTFDKLPNGAVFACIGIHPFSNFIYQKVDNSANRSKANAVCLSTQRESWFNTPKLARAPVIRL